MYSPQPQRSLSRGSSPNDNKRRNFNLEQSPSSFYSHEISSSKIRQPFVQDTLNRLTSPYKRSADDSSTKLTSFQVELPFKSRFEDINYPVVTPKKPRSSTGKKSTLVKSQRAETSEAPFDQMNVEDSLKDSLTTLKLVMRDYEDKQKEKKVLQKIVDQLKMQIEGLKARKNNFSKNFEKLHKDSLLMNDAAASKENQRKLIAKNIEQVKDAVIMHDKEIQEAISQNIEVANKIKAEQLAILKTKEKIAELKKNIPIEMKEKEKARNDLQISSKQLKSSQQKFESLAKEKVSYIVTIKDSKAIKK